MKNWSTWSGGTYGGELNSEKVYTRSGSTYGGKVHLVRMEEVQSEGKYQWRGGMARTEGGVNGGEYALHEGRYSKHRGEARIDGGTHGGEVRCAVYGQ